MPSIVDDYNDHSLLKLIAITYWIGFFSPISHRSLKQKYNYDVIYVDTMAGSGVTKTKRAADYLCGSCPSAFLRALESDFPFDKIIGVEIDSEKAVALKKRLNSLNPEQSFRIFDKDISEVSEDIVKEIGNRAISYVVIDPQGFKGMTWSAIGPLLKCKGDAMVTWFENDAWRIKEAALSDSRSSEGNAQRLTELLGTEKWRTAPNPSALTDLFVQRVLNETKRGGAAERIEIEDKSGKHYKMILFVGKSEKASYLAEEWKKYMDKRLGSDKGRNIGRLLDRKAGRIADLRDFLK